MFELWFIPLISKPRRVCKSRVTIIDNILTDCVFDNTLKKAIIKSDISDHSQIILLFRIEKIKANVKLLFIIKEILTRQTRRHSPLAACSLQNTFKHIFGNLSHYFSLQTSHCKTQKRKKILD